jgi:hypothetical protein
VLKSVCAALAETAGGAAAEGAVCTFVCALTEKATMRAGAPMI